MAIKIFGGEFIKTGKRLKWQGIRDKAEGRSDGDKIIQGSDCVAEINATGD